MPLLVGAGGADITGPDGVTLGGYWGRTSGATGVHSPVCCRALVLRSVASHTFALIVHEYAKIIINYFLICSVYI